MAIRNAVHFIVEREGVNKNIHMKEFSDAESDYSACHTFRRHGAKAVLLTGVLNEVTCRHCLTSGAYLLARSKSVSGVNHLDVTLIKEPEKNCANRFSLARETAKV